MLLLRITSKFRQTLCVPQQLQCLTSFVCSTLQGNWYEDRAQQTVGSNDGLRCATVAYKEMMEQQSVYSGPMQEISMPATQFGNVTTQEKSISLFPCTKYRHPKQLPTQRVLATYRVNPNLRMTTTSMLMSHGDQRTYTKDPRRPMLDTTNMKEALRPRPMEVPETGFGSVLPRFATDQELGVRYFDTCYRSHFVMTLPTRSPSPPLPLFFAPPPLSCFLAPLILTHVVYTPILTRHPLADGQISTKTSITATQP